MIRVNTSFCHWSLGKNKNNVPCRSGICRGKWHCLLSPALPVSCLISYPDSFSCLQSPTPVSSLIFCLLLSHVYCLQSSLFCFMSSVAYFILLSPISYFIRAGLTRPRLLRPHHIFHVCIASFGTASRLSHLLHIQMHSVDAMGEDTTVLKKHSWASLLLKVTFVKH